MNAEISKVVSFVSELERLKCVTRQNRILDSDRHENSAEHSWHVAMMAIVFERHIPYAVNLGRVIKMLLIHDIVEIDAGDAYFYDDAARAEAEAKERKAAKRLFGMLPENEGEELLELWNEFEAAESKDALYAKALDALQPLINHVLTGTPGVNIHGLTKSRVLQKKQFIRSVSEELWSVVCEMLEKAVAKELYTDDG